MSTELQKKSYNPYGLTNVFASDLGSSGKWNYAAQKFGFDKNQVDSVFNYWTNHPLLKNARYAQGFSGRGVTNEPTLIGPQGGGRITESHLDYAKKTTEDFDAFNLLRPDHLKKNKL